MAKRGTYLFLFLFFVIVFLSFCSASLGISPAIKEINFVPRQEHEFTYHIISDQPGREIEVSVGGDLARYVSVSKEKFFGGGSFKLRIKFPDAIETPGEHTIGVWAKEKPLETEFIGTAINIGAIIKVFVPYPGRYTEAQLNIPDGNVGEEIPVEVHVINRGKEPILTNVLVNFYSENLDEPMYGMTFLPAEIDVNSDRYFRKHLNTTGFKPGNYLGEAVVDYSGDKATKVNRTFRIGYLFVNITNFTRELPKKGIQKFFIDIESKWNNELSDVFADVNISNGIDDVSFRTPSTKLPPWNKKTLEGFVDTDELEGVYNVSIVLNYANEKTLAFGTLLVYKFEYRYVLIGIIVGIVILLVIVLLIMKLKRRKRK